MPSTSKEPSPTAGLSSLAARPTGVSRSARTTCSDTSADFPIAVVEASPTAGQYGGGGSSASQGICRNPRPAIRVFHQWNWDRRIRCRQGAPGSSRTSRRGRPSILTTSQLLTTGVDAPTCKNIVLARVVGSMSEFKQIIGRGTRVARGLRQALLQHPRLHRLGHAPVRRPGLRRRSRPSSDEEDDRRGGRDRRRTRDRGDGAESRDDCRCGERCRTEPVDLDDGAGHRPRKFYVDGGAGRDRPRTSSTSSTPTGKQLACVRSPTTPAKGAHALPNAPTSCAPTGPTPNAGRDHPRLEERGIDFDELAELPDSPTPTRSTCSAISPSTRRCAPGASGRTDCCGSRSDFFDRYGPEAPRQSSTSCSRSTPSTGRPVRAARRPRSPAVPRHGQRRPRSPRSSAAASSCASAVSRAPGACSTPPECKEPRHGPNRPTRRRAAAADHRPAARQLIKSARDIMRKDKGLNGDLDRLPHAHLDHVPQVPRRHGADRARSARSSPASDSARPSSRPTAGATGPPNADGITGDELLAFVNNEKPSGPTARAGPGLFAYLRELAGANGERPARRDRHRVPRRRQPDGSAATCCAT